MLHVYDFWYAVRLNILYIYMSRIFSTRYVSYIEYTTICYICVTMYGRSMAAGYYHGVGALSVGFEGTTTSTTTDLTPLLLLVFTLSGLHLLYSTVTVTQYKSPQFN